MTIHFAPIFFRWLHIIPACLLVGSAFFYDVLLPRSTRGLDEVGRDTVHLGCRRGFKMLVHITLLLMLISGIFNAWKNWPIYSRNPAVMHGLFGMHVLFGLGALTILMVALVGREAKRSQARWTRIAWVSLLIGVALASTLKSAREWTMTHLEPGPDRGAATMGAGIER